METSAFGFVPLGLDADWPARRWLEAIHGRRHEPAHGARLGHASDSAMVLTCTFPRARFKEIYASGSDPVRELAFETTYAQINLALHQIKGTGERPDGLIGSLVRYANQQANRYRDWPTALWETEAAASTTALASWQSGFSVDYPDVYVIVHACGIGLDQISLAPVEDLSRYYDGGGPEEIGAMHWELWRGRPDLGYDDLVRTLVAL